MIASGRWILVGLIILCATTAAASLPVPRELHPARQGPGYTFKNPLIRAGAPLPLVRGALRKLPPDWQIGVRTSATSFYFQPVGWILEHAPRNLTLTLLDGKLYPPRQSIIDQVAGQLRTGGKGQMIASEEFFNGRITVHAYYRPEDLSKLSSKSIVGLSVVDLPSSSQLLRGVSGLGDSEIVAARTTRIAMADRPTNEIQRQGVAESVTGFYRVRDLRRLVQDGMFLQAPEIRRIEAQGEPQASAVAPYRQSRKPLWEPKGPGANSVRQGSTLGDCWLLSTVGGGIRANARYVKGMVRKSPRGYKVRLNIPLASGEVATAWVPVSGELPKLGGLWTFYASDRHGKGVPIIEKAVAKVMGSYGGIDATDRSRAASLPDAQLLLYGMKPERAQSRDLGDDELLRKLHGWVEGGRAVTAGSQNRLPLRYWAAGVVMDHAYTVVGVDLKKKTVELRNPWGFYHPRHLAISTFRGAYEYVEASGTVR